MSTMISVCRDIRKIKKLFWLKRKHLSLSLKLCCFFQFAPFMISILHCIYFILISHHIVYVLYIIVMIFMVVFYRNIIVCVVQTV